MKNDELNLIKETPSLYIARWKLWNKILNMAGEYSGLPLRDDIYVNYNNRGLREKIGGYDGD